MCSGNVEAPFYHRPSTMYNTNLIYIPSPPFISVLSGF